MITRRGGEERCPRAIETANAFITARRGTVTGDFFQHQQFHRTCDFSEKSPVDVFLFFTLKKYLVSTFIGGARFIGRSTVARRSSEKIELTPVGSDTRERVQRVNRRDAGRGAAAHSAPRGGPDLEREGLRFGHLIRSRRLFAGSSTRRVYARGLRLLAGEFPGGWVTDSTSE